MQLLHIDSSVLGPHSASRTLSADIVARQIALHPAVNVVRRDLATDAALHLSSGHLAAWQGGAVEDPDLGADLAKGGAYLEELLARHGSTAWTLPARHSATARMVRKDY
jgi:FMN-dependent NADH-azoreductase